jgi:hypothetical protein
MFIAGENDSPFWITLRIFRQNHCIRVRAGCARLLPPVANRMPLLSSTSTPNRPATNAGHAPPPLPPCHRDNAPVAPPLVVNVKQEANNKRRACAATVTATMRPVVIASVASPLVVNAKQADDERWACAAVARRCHRLVQTRVRDHWSIPTIARQSCSPAPQSPPPHHPSIPFATVRAPLAPASLPSVVNRVKMWPLGWQLALRDSGLMPIRRLLARPRLSLPHLHPPILLAAVRTLLPPASTPPVVVVIFV